MKLSWHTKLFFGAWCIILLNGTGTVVMGECNNGMHPVYTTTKGRICCPKCVKNNLREPCEHKEMECRCHQGYGCQTKSCTECKELPACNTRERLKITYDGISHYTYKCEKCPSGTVLEKESGLCEHVMPVTTLLPSPTAKDLTNKSPTCKTNDPDNNSTWIFISVLVIFFLLLITIVIHLLIQKMKATSSLKMQGDFVPHHTTVPINVKDDGDTCSCQYPEEEHGDGVLNIKLAAF
ncbi:tumor necrosis factor receptor superfamily member 18 [Pyxicephalus adspersus]|uniref:tumor necrosis factor receptor superfamily member 18 n=1 Tax=Pyxicephalus adspersus TaxID=30357 RepID=UPI003B5AF9E7